MSNYTNGGTFKYNTTIINEQMAICQNILDVTIFHYFNN